MPTARTRIVAVVAVVVLTVTTWGGTSVAQEQHSVDVILAGAGTGVVASTGVVPTIFCGTDNGTTYTDCFGLYDSGTTVRLEAFAEPGSTFAGWSGFGDCGSAGACEVPVGTEDVLVTATFDLAPVANALTVALDGDGSGSVRTADGIEPPIDCGTSCTASYVEGTEITLSAEADPGSVFVGWIDAPGSACSTPSETCTFTMPATAVTVVAVFDPTRILDVAVDGPGTGSVTSSPAGISCGGTCSAPFALGLEVALTATPSSGSAFAGWSGAGCSGTVTCTVLLDADRSVTATFVPIGIAVGDATIVETDGRAVVTVPVWLTPAPSVTTTVWLRPSPGSARVRRDFLRDHVAVVVPAGGTTASVELMIVGDDVAEPVESFTVVARRGVRAGTVTIVDDDS